MTPVTLGMIGAGRIGQVHAANLATRIPGARLVAVADIAFDAARTLADKYGVAAAYDNAEAVLSDPGIDAILVTSATDTHPALIAGAAAAGKHIFCEKPLARTLAEIDAALVAVHQAGVKLQVGFNRRFDANFARVRRAIVEGEIGQPHLLHIISRDPGPPPISYIRVSGGLFLDMTIHDFDMARFLMGVEVSEIYASGAVLVDPAIGEAGDIDTALILLTFANGALGVIDNSRRAVYGYDQRVEVLGSAGAIHTENKYPNAAIISTDQAIRRDLPLHFFLERYADSFALELSQFVDAIVQNGPTPVSGEDGRVPVVMALAAARSLSEKRPVRLEEVEG